MKKQSSEATLGLSITPKTKKVKLSARSKGNQSSRRSVSVIPIKNLLKIKNLLFKFDKILIGQVKRQGVQRCGAAAGFEASNEEIAPEGQIQAR